MQGDGEVQEHPEQACGEAYWVGPLSGTVGGQATVDSNQLVQEPTLYMVHLTSLGSGMLFLLGVVL